MHHQPHSPSQTLTSGLTSCHMMGDIPRPANLKRGKPVQPSQKPNLTKYRHLGSQPSLEVGNSCIYWLSLSTQKVHSYMPSSAPSGNYVIPHVLYMLLLTHLSIHYIVHCIQFLFIFSRSAVFDTVVIKKYLACHSNGVVTYFITWPVDYEV